MTQEEYNRLDTDFVHCAGTHCEKAGQMPAPHSLQDAGREWE